MSKIETPELTALRFIRTPAWQERLESTTLSAQLLTVSKETNREIDYCHFEVVEGELVDPVTKTPIIKEIKRETGLDEVEYEIAVKLQEWAREKEGGLAVWISPKAEEYPSNQISIHQIAYTWEGRRVVRNSFIAFDADLKNPEVLRQILFTEEDSEEAVFGILGWIERVSGRKVNTDTQDSEKRRLATYFAGRIRAGDPPLEIVFEMRQTGFLGLYAMACAGGGKSLTGVLSENSSLFVYSGQEDQYGSLEFSCPKCGSTNVRPLGQLIPNCQHCGANVRC